MASALVSAVAGLLICALHYNEVESHEVMSSRNDPGAVYIKNLQEAVDSAAYQLIHDVTYKDYDVRDGDEFDFIVVGAGSAGSVMANRLSEERSWRVLLLEAGGDPSVTSEIPSLSESLRRSDLDWAYQSEPQHTCCLAAANQSCYYAMGKVLGGSSTINTMAYARANPLDYEGWEALGNHGWNYNNMLYYFKKSEDLRSDVVSEIRGSSKYHSKGGYLKVDSFGNASQFYKEYCSKAFNEMGYGSFIDFNADHHEGFFTIQGTLQDGRRCSTARAFLHDFQSRPNLKISKHSFVLKILIDGNNNAYGVEFSKWGRTIRVKAKKEVILSAGSLNTPKLLMLSGIGPRDHLREMGIDVVQDLKVGFNLQDHTQVQGIVISLQSHPVSDNQLEDTFQYLLYGKGKFEMDSFAAFIRTSKALYPNIQFFFSVYQVGSEDSVRNHYSTLGFNEVIQRSTANLNSKKTILLLSPTLTRPRSRGRVYLKSRNPFYPSAVYSGLLSAKEDENAMLETIHFIKELVNTKAMRRLGARMERIDVPACRHFLFQTDAYWRCLMHQMSVSWWHPSCTCSMGPPQCRESVVDPQLRVKGIQRLRVVDASVMPLVPNANLNAPTIAVAERASDIIKEFWKKHR